jgi:hypothetical protein
MNGADLSLARSPENHIQRSIDRRMRKLSTGHSRSSPTTRRFPQKQRGFVAVKEIRSQLPPQPLLRSSLAFLCVCSSVTSTTAAMGSSPGRPCVYWPLLFLPMIQHDSSFCSAIPYKSTRFDLACRVVRA